MSICKIWSSSTFPCKIANLESQIQKKREKNKQHLEGRSVIFRNLREQLVRNLVEVLVADSLPPHYLLSKGVHITNLSFCDKETACKRCFYH